MKIKFYVALAVAAGFFCVNPGLLQAGEKISLEEFIQVACRNDTTFQTILVDELTLQYKKALAIPAGDLVVSALNQYHAFFKTDEAEVSNSFSLSKLFPYIGTTVAADYVSSVEASSRTIGSELDVYVAVPIAENAFGSSTRLLDRITGLEIDVASHQIIEAYEDYLATLIQIYLDWYSAYKNVETAENSYKENMKLLENIKERQKNNIALPIDVNKINVQVLAKEENLVSLKNQYSRYLNLVKEAMRHKGKEDLEPQNPSLYDDVSIIFDEGYAVFCSQSRTYKILFLLEEKSSLELDREANDLLPSIELRLGYLLKGDEYDLQKSRKTAYGRVSLDWPFLGQLERAEYETSKISLKKRQLTNQSSYAGLYTSLRNIYDAIERERELIAVADEKISLAEAIVKDEAENYSYGKVSLNDYIDEINRLEDNKFSKISHTIQMRKLIVEWLRLTDTLVEKDDIPALTPRD
jgi:hypothetical protein